MAQGAAQPSSGNGSRRSCPACRGQGPACCRCRATLRLAFAGERAAAKSASGLLSGCRCSCARKSALGTVRCCCLYLRCRHGACSMRGMVAATWSPILVTLQGERSVVRGGRPRALDQLLREHVLRLGVKQLRLALQVAVQQALSAWVEAVLGLNFAALRPRKGGVTNSGRVSALARPDQRAKGRRTLVRVSFILARTLPASTLPSSTPHWSKLLRPQIQPCTAMRCS